MSKGRNKPCNCGSGKKFKKCCLNKKARTTTVTIDLGEPKAVNGLRITPDGKFELLQNGIPLTPATVNIETAYQRVKKEKILNKSFLQPQHITVNPNHSLNKFDVIFAIDTNSITLNGEKVSVACVVSCNVQPKGEYHLAEFKEINALEFRNVRGNPEIIACKTIIEQIMSTNWFKSSMNIAIIVDSELDKLKAYNSGLIALIDEFFLPSNFRLLYASADSGKEYLPNILILRCDKIACEIINYIENNFEDCSALDAVSSLPYTHFRIWRFE